MARKRKPAAASGGIPLWFMTYSDVVTLLMTFFILLLTFATNQPETFEQLRQSVFNGFGGFGIAGMNDQPVNQNSVVMMRVRSRLSRLTTRGSETPPMHSDTVNESLDKGLASLLEDSDLARLDRMTFDAPLSSFIDDSGQLTSVGEQHIRMLALQLTKMPLEVKFEVTRPEDVEAIVNMCDVLTNRFKIPTGRISTGIANSPRSPSQSLRITVTRST